MYSTHAFLVGVMIGLIMAYNALLCSFSLMGGMTTLWKILTWIITLHEIYTRLCFLLQTTPHSLSTTWKFNTITTNNSIFIILEGKRSASHSLLSLMGFITTLWTILSWIITLCEFFTCLCLLLHFLSTTWNICNTNTNTNTKNANIVIDDATPSKQKNDKLLRGEVEVVMGKLGIYYDPNGDEIGERVGKDDIEGFLEEEEVGLEEVREAFVVFDENCDGFIDANELEKVICALGFSEVSQGKCQRMIETFDENGDGKIDIREFVKLLENTLGR